MNNELDPVFNYINSKTSCCIKTHCRDAYQSFKILAQIVPGRNR